jgi:hypothetical protein
MNHLIQIAIVMAKTHAIPEREGHPDETFQRSLHDDSVPHRVRSRARSAPQHHHHKHRHNACRPPRLLRIRQEHITNNRQPCCSRHQVFPLPGAGSSYFTCTFNHLDRPFSSFSRGRNPQQYHYALDPALPNIATVLGDAGYITLGMVNVAILSNDNGFATGFDYYSWNENGAGRAGETVDEYLKWIDENAGNPKPVFCFMHLFDVHSPYDPPSPFDSLFSPGGDEGIVGWRHDSLTNVVLNPEDRDHLVDMYDGEIAWVDSQLSRLFSELRARGLDDNTLIVITADHGEEFLEHGGWGHSHALWQEILHVPLIICGPGIQAGLVDTLTAGQFDILPTICGYLSIASPPNLDGVNLLDSVPRSADRSIPSSRVGMDKVFQWGVEGEEGLVSVLTGNTKAVMDFVSGQPESMYDLLSDPGEQNPMEISPEMTELLDNYWTTPQTGNPTAANSDAINEQLRGLGYIR